MIYTASRDIDQRSLPPIPALMQDPARNQPAHVQAQIRLGRAPQLADRSARPTHLSDAATEEIIAAQIVCVARAWNDRPVIEVPVGSNRGPQVDLIHKRYNAAWITAANPYCAEFVWVVCDDAFRALGIVNPFPGYSLAYANAKKTLDQSLVRGIPTDVIPMAGDVFYRFSTDPKASGHMGIVIEVLPTEIVTIEGNQGDTSRVGLYHIPIAQVRDARNGWQFIHVRKTAAPATIRITADCAPKTPTVTPGTQPSGSTPSGGAPSSGGSSGSITTSRVTDTRTSQAEITAAEEAAKEAKKLADCNVIIKEIRIPVGEKVPHWTTLRDIAVASDIVGSRNVPFAQRNGAAVGHLTGSSGEADHSGIGVFRDRNNNIIWVCKEDSAQWAIMNKFGLWGRGTAGKSKNKIPIQPYVFPLTRFCGDGSGEKNALIIADKIDQRDPRSGSITSGCKAIHYEYLVYGAEPSGIAFKTNAISGHTFSYSNIGALLGNIESIGLLDRPIVVLLAGDAYTFKDGISLLTQAAETVLSTLTPYAKQLNIQSFLTDATLIVNAVKQLVRGKVAIPADLGALMSVAQAIAPPSIRPYVKDGADIYDDFVHERYASILGRFGITTQSAQSFAKGIFDGTAVADLVNQTKIGFEKATAVVKNALNCQILNDLAGRLAEVNDFASYVTNEAGDMVAKEPSISNLLLSGAVGGLLPVTPNVSRLMGMFINQAQDEGAEIQDLTRPGQLDRLAAFALTGLGIPRSSTGAFDQLVYNSLRGRLSGAIESAKGKLANWVMPAGIPDEKRDCYAYQLFMDNNKETTILTGTTSTTQGGSTSGGSTKSTSMTTTSGGRTSTIARSTATTTSGSATSTNNSVNNQNTTIARSTVLPTSSVVDTKSSSIFTDGSDGTVTNNSTTNNSSSNSGGGYSGGTVYDTGGGNPCPPGYAWDGYFCSPVPSTTMPPPKIDCGPGYHWDDQVKACVPDPHLQVATCPDTHIWDGERCVPRPELPPPPFDQAPPPPQIITCPDTHVWDGQRCVPRIEPQRPYVPTEDVPPPLGGPSPGGPSPGGPSPSNGPTPWEPTSWEPTPSRPVPDEPPVEPPGFDEPPPESSGSIPGESYDACEPDPRGECCEWG